MYLSILIRNLNESKSLYKTLTALKQQQTTFEYEVILVDNESDDNSVEIAKKLGCKIYILPRNEFTFGKALNYGISKCSGEIIVVLSAHVVLLNELFLDKIPFFFKNRKIAALRFTMASASKQASNNLINGPVCLKYNNDKNFAENNWNHFIVNHCSAFRFSCWQIQKFDEEIFSSEDKLWSLQILKKGFTILYNVPCFYIYIKDSERNYKIQKRVIDIAAREIITGQSWKEFSSPLIMSFFKKVVKELERSKTQLQIHYKTYAGLKKRRSALK